MKKLQHASEAEASHNGRHASNGFLEGFLIIAALGSFAAYLIKQQTASLESAMRAESEYVRSSMSPSEAAAPADADAAFHWGEMMEKLPQDMHEIGMTDRQTQVGMGVIRQQTYQQIAKEVRLDERTVRQHATYAFRKVGCSKKSEFLSALMARIKSLR